MAGDYSARHAQDAGLGPEALRDLTRRHGLGYFLYQGVIVPLGGINSLCPLFGISNQMLAAIALSLGTVVLFRTNRWKLAWVTIVPTVWLLVCTLTAGWQKLFHPDTRIGFLAHAARYSDSLARGEQRQIVFNDYLGAALWGLFVAVMLAVVVYAIKAIAGELDVARHGVRNRID